MESMRAHLEKANFDRLIKNSVHLLPPIVHDLLDNFTHKLLAMEDSNQFVFIENWEWFSLSAKTPTKMEELFEIIKDEIRDAEGNNDKKKVLDLEQFGRRIRWKWCEAAFNYAYHAEVGKNGKCGLNFV
jgi:hypothetical protein